MRCDGVGNQGIAVFVERDEEAYSFFLVGRADAMAAYAGTAARGFAPLWFRRLLDKHCHNICGRACRGRLIWDRVSHAAFVSRSR